MNTEIQNLSSADIALADYVVRFSQWSGAEVPSKNETPSGQVVKALEYAVTVKKINAAVSSEISEGVNAFNEALEAELFPINQTLVLPWDNHAIIEKLGAADPEGAVPVRREKDSEAEWSDRLKEYKKSTAGRWFTGSRLMAWEGVRSQKHSKWIQCSRKVGGLSLSVAALFSECLTQWGPKKGRVADRDIKIAREKLMARFRELKPVSILPESKATDPAYFSVVLRVDGEDKKLKEHEIRAFIKGVKI